MCHLPTAGVTGYFAPQEIWHPHSISPSLILQTQDPILLVCLKSALFLGILECLYPRLPASFLLALQVIKS